MVGRRCASESSGLTLVARKRASKFAGLRYVSTYVIMDSKSDNFRQKSPPLWHQSSCTSHVALSAASASEF